MTKERVETREYIEIPDDFTGYRPEEPRDIDCVSGKPTQSNCASRVGVTMFIGGIICTGLGAGVHVPGLLWTGLSSCGTIFTCMLSVACINGVRRKIYKIQDGEYRRFYKATEETARKPYNYPVLLDSIQHRLLSKKWHTQSDLYDETQEILEDSNSNSDFQEKREKIQQDFEILTWKIIRGYFQISKKRSLRSELDFLNEVMTKLAEKKWFMAKKLLNFLLINKATSRGSFLDGIFQTGANCFPKDLNIKTICTAMLDDEKSSIDNEAFEREIADNLKIINKNNAALLEREKRKEKDNGPLTISMR